MTGGLDLHTKIDPEQPARGGGVGTLDAPV
jgi:hypothetical protein